MSSFTENVISSESKLMPTVDSISRDGKGSLPSFQNTLPESRSGVLKPHFQSNNHNGNNFSKHPNLSIGLPCTTADTRDTPVAYADDQFAGNPNISFLRWKKCSPKLQPRDRIRTGCHAAESQVTNPQNDTFDYQCGAASGYQFRSNLQVNGINTKNATDYMFPDGGSSSSWCPVSWPEQGLDHSNNLEWARSLQDPTTDVDSLFRRSELDRSWGNRAVSGSVSLASHRNAPILRSSEVKVHNAQQNHGPRDRTSSASSSMSADSPTNIPAVDESRSINLPSVHSVKTADFDVATCLPNAIARMSFVADSPVIQQPLPSSESTVLGQLSAVGKPLQVQPSFWPMPTLSQEGVPCSGVDSLLFNKKIDDYHRPATSEQDAQLDALVTLRNRMPCYAKVPSALGYAGDGLDPGQQAGGPGSGCLADDQLWYYEDPQGRIQGEFTNSQMFNWFHAGRYFTPSLRIRRKCDDTFSTLHSYIQLFGLVLFSGTAQIPPIRGGITPQLIFLRTQDRQNPSNTPFTSPDQLHKLSRSTAADGDCTTDTSGGFGKNGAPCSNAAVVASQALLLKQLVEMIASNSGTAPIDFNNSLFFLSDWLSKARIHPSVLQQMINTVGYSNSMANCAWPPPSSQSLPSQQQQQQQPPIGQSTEGAFSSSASTTVNPGISGFMNTTPRTGEAARATAAGIDIRLQSVSDLNVDSCSPTASRHKSAAGTNSDGGASVYEVKSKQNADAASTTLKNSLPRQKCSPTGVKSDSWEGNASGHQPQRAAASQSGCSNCSAPPGGTWSNKPLQFNSNVVDCRVLGSTLKQPQPESSKPIKNCWMEKAATVVKTPVGKVGANPSAKQPPTTSPPDENAGTRTSEALLPDNSGSTKKKAKSRQQQATLQNGVKKSDDNETASCTKSRGSAVDNPALTNELNVLIRWTQSALTGIQLKEMLDIPTFVELLTTIDAPYEVESMLIAYLGNSPRSEQFVRDFLDRRHTCWQLHRKRVEEMQKDSKLKKKNNKKTKSPSAQSASTMPSVCNEGIVDAYSEANDSQADSAWQQIKPKNISGRRVKKERKQHS